MKLYKIVLRSCARPYVGHDNTERTHILCSACYQPQELPYYFGIQIVSKRQLLNGRCEICKKELKNG